MKLTATIILMFSILLLSLWSISKWNIIKEVIKVPGAIFNEYCTFEGKSGLKFFSIPLLLLFIMTLMIGFIWLCT